MTNKGMIANKDITLIDGKNVITDEYELSQIEHCRKKLRKQT